jgi:hypothetical protein
MTDTATITRPSQAEAWKKFGVTAAGVAGAVILAEAFLNRETRDGLSTSEQEYLHSSFKYTGGGLVLTALAARTLFKNGFAYRIMAANPCTSSFFLSLRILLTQLLSRGRSGCKLGRFHWKYDGCVLHTPREHRPKASILAGEFREDLGSLIMN